MPRAALQALVTSGADDQVRWQAGYWLLRQQRLAEALDVLNPSLLASGNSDILNSQLTALLSNGQWRAAAALAESSALPAQRMHRHVAAGLAYTILSGIVTPDQLPELHALLDQAIQQPHDSLNLDYLMARLDSDAEAKRRLEDALRRQTDNWQLASRASREPAVPEAVDPPVGNLPVWSLGSELLDNGGFEQLVPRFGIVLAEDWFERKQPPLEEWDRSVFVTLVEQARGSDSALSNLIHVEGVAVERDGGGNPSLSGIQHAPIAVEVGQPYLLSLRYRTEGVTERGFSVWTSGVADFFGERFLPPTDGNWRQAAFLFRSKASTLAPWLRLWSTGTVWVDDVSLRPVEWNDSTPLPDDVLVVPDVDAFTSPDRVDREYSHCKGC